MKVVSIIDLINDKKRVVKPVDLVLKAGGEGFDKYAGYDFKDKPFFIESLQKNGEKLHYLRFFNEGVMKQIAVPNDFKVIVISGKEKVKLLREYDGYCVQNIRGNLGKYFRIGSDPEIFVEDNKGQVIPAFNFLGSKEEPDRTYAGAYGNEPMYWDGFQAEFATHADTCLAWQSDSVQCGLKGVLLKAKAKYPKAKLSAQTVMDIPFEELQKADDKHVEFGCMPSKNAYGLKGISAPGREVPFRSAGGHIHFGIDEGKIRSEETKIKMVKALDAILGVACVSLFAKFDNPKRREMYGLAGEYRTPPHGLEYRTLSNAWLFHPLIMNLVFDLARKALVFGEQDYMKFWKVKEQETIDVIQKCDVKGARKILLRNKKIMIELIRSSYNYLNEAQAKKFFNIFYKGMETVVKDPTDIEGNWNLSKEWVTHCNGKGKNVLYGHPIILDNKKVS